MSYVYYCFYVTYCTYLYVTINRLYTLYFIHYCASAGAYCEPEGLSELTIFAINKNNDSIDFNVLLKTPYNGHVHMKIDTQASCNTLSKQTFNNMKAQSNIVLVPTNTKIKAFGNSVVQPIGKTTFEVIVKQQRLQLTCEVIDGENIPNLLSAEDSVRLGLVERVHKVNISTGKPERDGNEKQKQTPVAQASNIPLKPTSPNPSPKPPSDQKKSTGAFIKRIPNYPDVPKEIVDVLVEFQDRFPEDTVGCIPGEISLSLDPEYKDGPVSFGSRPIPAALKEQTKAQLDFLERQGIITKVPVGVPTPWCSQMHVVHKKDGKSVRICIDPKFLNRAILREFHPLKTIEDILSQVEGSKFFTKLDANKGFFQIQLDYESQLLCAMNTPWGRYMYQRLPMGIKSCPEIYQRKIEETTC